MREPSLFRLVAALLLVVSLSAGCAATDADQGKADQGGSVGTTPTVAIYIGTGGGISTIITPTPTAAPAATSQADAQQSANQSNPVAIDPEGVAGAIKTLGGVPTIPVVTPEPAE